MPASLPAAPTECDWTHGITDFGMMLNDVQGDCVFAAGGHAIQTFTGALGLERTPIDDQIQAYYEAWAGFRPGDPSTDQGYVIVDFLNNWRKLEYCGAILDGYADPDPNNTEHIKQSVLLFGGVDIGLQLPLAWQDADIWDVEGGSQGERGSWGGHSVWVPAYNPTGPVCVSWGRLKQMTWAGFAKYCDEAHTLRSPLFLDANGVSASQVDLAAWDADLSLLAG